VDYKLVTGVRSRDMMRRVTATLGQVIADAQERGKVATNAERSLSRRRSQADRKREARHKEPLEVGKDIPESREIATIIRAAKGRERPLLMIASWCGLRASELRGLRWKDIEPLDKRELRVRQKADRYNKIGSPKSAAARRTLEIPKYAIPALKEWKLKCPKGERDLVFPNSLGNVESHPNLIQRGLHPTMMAAGVTEIARDEEGKPILDDDGKPLRLPKYSGLHCFRHYFASLLINRRSDGGCGYDAKKVQVLMGHSSVMLMLNIYGHLFKSSNDSRELDAVIHANLG
jgi:integrase